MKPFASGRLISQKGTPADQSCPQHGAGHVTGCKANSDSNKKLRNREVVHRSGTLGRQREDFIAPQVGIDVATRPAIELWQR
jgi:hypothetical protein